MELAIAAGEVMAVKEMMAVCWSAMTSLVAGSWHWHVTLPLDPHTPKPPPPGSWSKVIEACRDWGGSAKCLHSDIDFAGVTDRQSSHPIPQSIFVICDRQTASNSAKSSEHLSYVIQTVRIAFRKVLRVLIDSPRIPFRKVRRAFLVCDGQSASHSASSQSISRM